ncbi:MAG: YceD family protein [Lachnospiraceae bacterium]
MLLNLTDVLTSEGKVRSEDIAIEMTAFKSRMGSFPIVEKSPLHLELRNIGENKAEVAGHAEITQQMCCDRCLKEVPVRITLDFVRTVFAPDVNDSEILDESDQGVMDGYQMDVEVLVYNELLMNQPEKVLCKPDCKGICKKCGKDLNEGDCGCDTFVPDPRMAVLQDIFNANKEV